VNDLEGHSRSSAIALIDRLSSDSWLRDTPAERRSLAGELSLSCAPPVADG